MKNRMRNVLMILVASFLLSAPSFAQDPALGRLIREETEKADRDRAAMNKAMSSSPPARALHERLLQTGLSERDLSPAMAKVISAGDRSVIPYLKARLNADYGGRSQIEVVLVRLGEKEYVDEAIRELASDNFNIQHLALWKLSMFGTREAYRKLYELLDDESPRGKVGDRHFLVRSWAYMVKDTLAATAEDPPQGADRYSTAAWKAWFEKNRHLIDWR